MYRDLKHFKCVCIKQNLKTVSFAVLVGSITYAETAAPLSVFGTMELMGWVVSIPVFCDSAL